MADYQSHSAHPPATPTPTPTPNTAAVSAAATAAGSGSGGGGRQVDSTSQVTACHRCRKQKLRCSRETPSCKRCQDISAVCTYPPPPDRKLLAAQRAQNAKARSMRESGVPGDQRNYAPGKASTTSDELSPLEQQDTSQSVRASRQEVPTRISTGLSPPSAFPSPDLLPVSFPSKKLALALIDAYFNHLYNATLLFHKQTLISDYLTGQVPDCVALSVFALGAVFLTESKGPNIELNPLLPGSHRPGEDWARAASQQALMNCDQPRYETVQACQTLALYWWAFNQTDRTNMHNHIAYRTCRLLGYHNPHASGPTDDQFHLELKRRAFWCSWSMCCLSQNNASFKAESWREVIGLPLPCDEISFSARQPFVRETYNTEGHLERLETDQPEDSRTSYMAEMVKLLSLWWEIQRFAKRFIDAGPLDSLKRLSQLQELDQQLELVHENLGLDFQHVDQSSFANREVAQSYQVYSVHALYHLCVCTLHSSIVPVFSNFPPDPRISKKLTRMSAEEAVKHSQNLLNMATEFLGIHPEKTRCPSFSAYAMFVAASIQFKSLGAQGLLRSESIGRLYPAISILERVKRIWRPLEGLWATLDTLFRGAGMDINRLSEDRQLLAQPESNPNIEQIVAHGVVMGSTDIYTYVPDEAYNETSSRDSSASLSRRGSDNSQHAQYQRKSSSGKLKTKSPSPQASAGSIPFTMPMHPRHNPTQMHPNSLPPQPYNMHQGGNMYQQQSMLSGTSPAWVPMNPVPENIQPGGPGFAPQMTGPEYTGGGMDIANDNMDLDSMTHNLWWDQPFDAVPSERYGAIAWDPFRYQTADPGEYYRS